MGDAARKAVPKHLPAAINVVNYRLTGDGPGYPG